MSAWTSWEILYQSEFGRLEVDPARRLVRYTRSAVPFPTIEDAEAMFRAIGDAKLPRPRRELVLLSDVRAAVGRNDAAFEKTVNTFSAELFEGFAKRAALVRTVVGSLQVKRLNRERVLPVEVFVDEDAALAYLGL
jgi:hypothetical protein